MTEFKTSGGLPQMNRSISEFNLICHGCANPVFPVIRQGGHFDRKRFGRTTIESIYQIGSSSHSELTRTNGPRQGPTLFRTHLTY